MSQITTSGRGRFVCRRQTHSTISPPVPIDQGPNRGRKVVYVRDADGVTLEFIEAPVG